MVHTGPGENLGHMAWFRTEVDDGRAHGQHVVDLARVHEAEHGIAHDHDVRIGGGERGGELCEGLIRQAQHIGAPAGGGPGLDALEFTAAADKTEHDGGIGGQGFGRLHQGVERMHGAVVAGIHHNIFVGEAVLAAELVPPGGVKAHVLVLRPRGQDGDFFRGNALGNDAVAHEAVEGNDPTGAPEAEAGHAFEAAGGEGIRAQPAGGDGLVGVHIHDPVTKARAPQPGAPGADEGDERRRGEGDHDVVPRQHQQPGATGQDEAGKIQGAMPFGALAKIGGINAEDVDATPRFAGRVDFLRMIVGTPGAHHGDLVPGLDEGGGQFAKVLCGGGNIGIKHLIQQKNFHETETTRKSIKRSNLGAADGDADGPGNRLLADEHEIAAAAGTGEFPAESLAGVVSDHGFDGGVGHVREEADLGFKGGAHLPAELRQVLMLDGLPAASSGGGQRADARRGNFFAFEDVEIRRALAERDEEQMFLEPVQNFGVGDGRNFGRPILAAIVQAVQAGIDDADGILRAGEDFGAGRIFEREQQPGELGGVAGGQIGLPQLDGPAAGTGGHAAALVELDEGLERNGQHGAGAEFGDVRLIEPATGQVQPVRNPAFLAQAGGGAHGEVGVREALGNLVVNAQFRAEVRLGAGVAVFIDQENIRGHAFEFGHEIHYAGTAADEAGFHMLQGFEHVFALGLGVDGGPALQIAHGLVGPEGHIDVAQAGGFCQEAHMAAVEHVEAAADEDFFLTHDGVGGWGSRWCAPASERGFLIDRAGRRT